MLNDLYGQFQVLLDRHPFENPSSFRYVDEAALDDIMSGLAEDVLTHEFDLAAGRVAPERCAVLPLQSVNSAVAARPGGDDQILVEGLSVGLVPPQLAAVDIVSHDRFLVVMVLLSCSVVL